MCRHAFTCSFLMSGNHGYQKQYHCLQHASSKRQGSSANTRETNPPENCPLSPCKRCRHKKKHVISSTLMHPLNPEQERFAESHQICLQSCTRPRQTLHKTTHRHPAPPTMVEYLSSSASTRVFNRLRCPRGGIVPTGKPVSSSTKGAPARVTYR